MNQSSARFTASSVSALPPSLVTKSRLAFGFVRSNLPRRSQINYYYWYYGSLAMYPQQGADWAEWNRTARPLLLRHQVRNRGRHDGSWDPIGQWGAPAGRCVTTGFATLSLEVYYRYLPLARANNMNK